MCKFSVEDTIGIIKRAHKDQVDKAGKPFWEHPYRVMKYLPPSSPDSWKLAALMHDLLEDTYLNLQHLQNWGYSNEVLDVVVLMTHSGGSYFDYIKNIKASGNKAAIAVKMADLMDNSDPERLRQLPDGGASLATRYKKALAILAR